MMIKADQVLYIINIERIDRRDSIPGYTVYPPQSPPERIAIYKYGKPLKRRFPKFRRL